MPNNFDYFDKKVFNWRAKFSLLEARNLCMGLPKVGSNALGLDGSSQHDHHLHQVLQLTRGTHIL